MWSILLCLWTLCCVSYFSSYCFLFFFLRFRRPPTSTLFPYTTLFRSCTSSVRARNNNQPVMARKSGPSSWCAANLAGSEEHTSELQSRRDLVCRLLLEKKKKKSKKLLY